MDASRKREFAGGGDYSVAVAQAATPVTTHSKPIKAARTKRIKQPVVIARTETIQKDEIARAAAAPTKAPGTSTEQTVQVQAETPTEALMRETIEKSGLLAQFPLSADLKGVDSSKVTTQRLKSQVLADEAKSENEPIALAAAAPTVSAGVKASPSIVSPTQNVHPVASDYSKSTANQARAVTTQSAAEKLPSKYVEAFDIKTAVVGVSSQELTREYSVGSSGTRGWELSEAKGTLPLCPGARNLRSL